MALSKALSSEQVVADGTLRRPSSSFGQGILGSGLSGGDQSVACRPRFPYMEPLHVRSDLFWAYESVLGGYRNPDISLRRLKNLVAIAFR